jgi:hypothetical protein
VVGEGAAPRDVQVPGEPGDPAQHLHRRHVEIGTLGPPRRDQIVHFVPHYRHLEELGVGVVLGTGGGALGHY